MINKRMRKDGFSIAELMLAMLATAIMAMAVGSVLVYTWAGWSRQSKSVEMQRDVTMAMQLMAREIRGAETVSAGTSLTCTSPDSDVVVFASSGRNLTMKVNSATPMVLVRNTATAFSSSLVGTRAVRIALSTNTGSDDSTVQMVISRRN